MSIREPGWEPMRFGSPSLGRRDFLRRCGMGLGGLAFGTLLADSADVALRSELNPLAPKPSPFPARVKRVVHFFLNGGPSQVDTFDPKPALARYAGKPLPTGNLATENVTGGAFPSPFEFRRYGRSGIEVSELFAKTAEHADDLAVIR